MTEASNTAVAMQGKHPIVVYRERFEDRTTEIKNMLPPGISPERFIRACVTAAQLNPEIHACTWQSIWNSAAKACRDGLLPDGVHAAFVPYKSVCSYLPMVRGRMTQFYRSGVIKWVTAMCVYEGEEYKHWIDEHGEHIYHTPSDIYDDKKIVRAYAMATTKEGAVFIAVMPRAEIDKHRSFSRTTRADAPWVMHYAEMSKKTTLHRLSKMVPNAPPIEDDYEDEDSFIETDTRPQLTAVNPNRERGAAAALDAFAASSDDGPAHSDDTRGSVDATSDGDGGRGEAVTDTPLARSTSDQSTATATSNEATKTPVEIAHQRGVDARAAGHQRKALPPEYRAAENDHLAQSWLNGWDGK